MENIYYLIITWIGAAIMLGVGIYDYKYRTKPVKYGLSNSTSDRKITDVKAYNKAHGKLWYIYSAFLWLGGIFEYFFPEFSIFFFILYSTVGVGASVWYVRKIEEKYIVYSIKDRCDAGTN